jgi:hypothetical protein
MDAPRNCPKLSSIIVWVISYVKDGGQSYFRGWRKSKDRHKRTYHPTTRKRHRDTGKERTVKAVPRATSRKAREVAHPQLL